MLGIEQQNIKASESLVTKEEMAMLMDRRMQDRTEHWTELEREVKLVNISTRDKGRG